MSLAIQILSGTLVALGTGFFLVGTLGLLRLPDLFTRLHALTKADNLGLALVILGLMPWVSDVFQGLKLLLIWVLVLASSATASHLIAKRAALGEAEEL
ncbi:cation:proton antiporter [Imhoffiella purpurea]|uniref:Monovalent cation/proton antiporter, MnhG/PhaG subunit n=1 Tax=Imhoffiella purpurea TaxID=1249627 RepID=W9V2K2_9GAMM|nr:monovalent cation/H(+) antiporter subunit G [Imhoffiella purpurea]EXJ13733.1 monovalent cation/proton antiporter, MnhG/PhaG subunit [Imhoffiella purpurea]